MKCNRRVFLSSFLATMGAKAAGLSAGLLTARQAISAWPKEAYEQTTLDGALKAVLGSNEAVAGDIQLKAPEIAENGAVVPVQVKTSIPNVESMTILIANNPAPWIATYYFLGAAEPFVSTRVKMGKTSQLIVLVKADGKYYKTSKEVQVTNGGCG